MKKLSLPDFLVCRHPDTSKADYGHALLVAGAYGKMGCAVLAARACLRAGVGLLTVHVPARGVDILQTACPEAMLSIDADENIFSSLPSHLDRYHAVAVGPGIGTDEQSFRALEALLSSPVCPRCVILDADALNLVSMHPDTLFPLLPADAILTPHAREYERLCGGKDIAPADFAQQHRVTLLLKGHHTIVAASDGRIDSNNTGNAGMATAGSGDVLTGLMLGLAAQCNTYSASPQYDNYELALLAACLHGKSGDLAAAKQAQCTIVASDIVENLKYAID